MRVQALPNEVLEELYRCQPKMEVMGFSEPTDVLDFFFDSFTIEKTRNILWELYRCCVAYYDREKTSHDDAAELLLFYSYSEVLFEAAWVLHQKHRLKRKQLKKKTLKSENKDRE